MPAGLLAGSVTRDRRAKWWRRTGCKSRGFRYEAADGRRVEDGDALERIKSLAVPPAWREVRISPSPRSALQAIGVDKAGRVQRIYHPSFVARRALRKYQKVERFGEALPLLRRRTNEDIAREGLGKERVLAVIVRLINDLYFRVGSEESVRRYRTYGVTTLRNRHLEIKRGGQLVFTFTGKHHIKHRRILVDEELAALVRDIKSLGGSKLFQYVGEDGRKRPVTPRDVNDYIKAAAGAGVLREGLSHVGRDAAGVRRAGRTRLLRRRARGEEECRRRRQARGRASGQHADRLPLLLHPPLGARGLRARPNHRRVSRAPRATPHTTPAARVQRRRACTAQAAARATGGARRPEVSPAHPLNTDGARELSIKVHSRPAPSVAFCERRAPP